MRGWRMAALLLCAAQASEAGAAQPGTKTLQAKFSCSAEQEVEGQKVLLADTGEFSLKGGKIGEFRWESALHRRTHGFDCSIDRSDGLVAETTPAGWRVTLKDGKAARRKRGFEFGSQVNCSIRLTVDGDQLQIQPSCPALCGSRRNFSALTVNLKTGSCSYEQE